MIKNEQVKEVIKQSCKLGCKSDKDANQIMMIEALVKIKDIYINGFPSEDVFEEYMLMEQHILKIITQTLEALTPVYD
jgi:hypothetical protein